jgi:hypothetical protein
VVECTGLENRRGCKLTVGSNPTLSASILIKSISYGYFLIIPTFLPTFSHELATDRLAPKVAPPIPFEIPANQDPTGVPPPILVDGTHSSFLHTILLVRLDGFCLQTLPPTLRAMLRLQKLGFVDKA